MRCLEDDQICAWAEEHGLTCGNGSEVPLPDLPPAHFAQFADGRKSGAERSAAEDLIVRLDSWVECLVWIRGWGVWPSGEDWPQFYLWRGAFGERRSLDKAPGHLFGSSERVLVPELLTLIMENAWDADVLCSSPQRRIVARARISHDEWYEVMNTTEAG